MRIIIVGGGFLGQLLHTLIPNARVFDWRPAPPKVPARQLGPQYLWEPLPHLLCRSFDVFTTVDGREATEESILAYKKKVDKELDNSDWRAQFQYRMRGYDPLLPEDRVEYGRRVLQVHARRLELADGHSVPYEMIISTIPMPHMLQMCGLLYRFPPLRHQPIYVETQFHSIQTDHPMEVDYISDPNNRCYRSTLREGKRYNESLKADGGDWAKIMPGKIYDNPAVPEMRSALLTHGVICFGRFARWSPDELAHETFKMASNFVKEVGI